MTVNREKPLRRAILSRGVSFWAVAAIGLLAAATNAAASPLYRVYQLQFGFSATTLTLLFTVGRFGVSVLDEDVVLAVRHG